MKGKPILCVDFDGVIHDYKHGWRDGSIYGHVTPGFFAWAEQAALQFDLVIHSSRAKTAEGAQAILSWLVVEAEAFGNPALAGMFEVSAVKPPAFLTIDDRCVRFDGDWSAYELLPAELRSFKPWTQHKEPAQ